MRLLRALALFAFVAMSGASAGAATSLLDYVRTRDAAATSFGRQRALPAFLPSAFMAPEAATFGRHGKDAFLLYVSTIAPDGAGSVRVFAGWIHGSHPPAIGKITGLDTPSALAVDRYGTLYVCQTDVGAPVLVFPFLERKPARELETEGTLPVSVTVAPDGTVYVATAQYGNTDARILMYPPGATKPAFHTGPLAGDAVAALQSNARGTVFFAADYIDSPSYVGELARRAVRRFINVANDTQVTNIELDAFGNVLALDAAGELTVYGRGSGAALATLKVPENQSLTFGRTYGAFYAASGTITRYAYPSGSRLDTITSLAADQTFGLATFPRVPYAP